MKFAEELFPKGTFPSQQTDGAYIDEALANNLNVIAEKIGDDMSFLILISGHDMVGNGKSTLGTHIGSYLTWKINKMYNVNNTFTHDNIVMKGEKLIDISFKMPKYSVLKLDEGDDLTTHGLKELAIVMKRYFRKCRQLNQILILILPSFFELPKFYALSRSQCLLDVEFKEKFDRGYFSFYGMKSKKLLYIKGRREWDYSAQKPDFTGRFFSSYCFFPDCQKETEAYRKAKYDDMVEDNQEQDKKKSKIDIEREIKADLFRKCYQNIEGMTIKRLSAIFGVSSRTGDRWLANKSFDSLEESENEIDSASHYTN